MIAGLGALLIAAAVASRPLPAVPVPNLSPAETERLLRDHAERRERQWRDRSMSEEAMRTILVGYFGSLEVRERRLAAAVSNLRPAEAAWVRRSIEPCGRPTREAACQRGLRAVYDGLPCEGAGRRRPICNVVSGIGLGEDWLSSAYAARYPAFGDELRLRRGQTLDDLRARLSLRVRSASRRD